MPLADAAGRVAACDVTAPVDVPPFARSAMDGYAVVAADTHGRHRHDAGPAADRRSDLHRPGVACSASTPGTCAEIATGAPLPDGADAVVMVEETAPAADAARGRSWPRPRPARTSGAAAPTSAPAISSSRRGDLLSPSRVGALAAIGCANVEVYARPRVAVLSTGNEVIDPGTPLAPGQIYDVNRFTLAAVVAAHGGLAEPHPPVHDTLDALTAALDACAGADVIVFSGGSSVGERDLIVDLIAARGELIFHGIAVKPGKPTAFAMVGGTPFFGMPGNPTSCLSNAYILLVPFLRATARLPLYRAAHRPGAARHAHRLAGRPSPVLHRPPARRQRVSGLQGVGRDHEPVAGRRLHRDSRRPEHGRRRDAWWR